VACLEIAFFLIRQWHHARSFMHFHTELVGNDITILISNPLRSPSWSTFLNSSCMEPVELRTTTVNSYIYLYIYLYILLQVCGFFFRDICFRLFGITCMLDKLKWHSDMTNQIAGGL
jgi:hypothetical protein